MNSIQNYTVCLPDWESVLPKLSSIIEASYQSGDFNSFEGKFTALGKDESFWSLSGNSGCELSIKLEKYEGYLFGTLSGSGDAFVSGSCLLWKSYLEQGGDPKAQKAPCK